MLDIHLLYDIYINSTVHLICKHRVSVSRYILWEPIKLFLLNCKRRDTEKNKDGTDVMDGGCEQGWQVEWLLKVYHCIFKEKKKEQPWEEYLSKSSVDKKHSFVDSAASLINGFIQKQKTYRKGLG